jgi:hypothetical protein
VKLRHARLREDDHTGALHTTPLAGGCSGDVVKPHTRRGQHAAQRARNLAGNETDRDELVVADLPEIAAVSPRCDQRMATGRRRDIEERDDGLT